MKNNIFLILFLLISQFAFSQIDWPIPPFNQQHGIAGTIGEYRDDNRFHQGTDVVGTGSV